MATNKITGKLDIIINFILLHQTFVSGMWKTFVMNIKFHDKFSLTYICKIFTAVHIFTNKGRDFLQRVNIIPNIVNIKCGNNLVLLIWEYFHLFNWFKQSACINNK